jgi:L-amino acid N-acyltransferase YncA
VEAERRSIARSSRRSKGKTCTAPTRASRCPNPESIRLHERLGFREIGTYEEVGRKFDRYWSVRWYEKAL